MKSIEWYSMLGKRNLSQKTQTYVLYAITLTTEANWSMKIDTSEYVDVRTINNHFGYDICCTLPQRKYFLLAN